MVKRCFGSNLWASTVKRLTDLQSQLLINHFNEFWAAEVINLRRGELGYYRLSDRRYRFFLSDIENVKSCRGFIVIVNRIGLCRKLMVNNGENIKTVGRFLSKLLLITNYVVLKLDQDIHKGT